MLAKKNSPGNNRDIMRLILPDITDRQAMRELLRRYHPADIADALEELPPDEQSRLVSLLNPEEQGDLLSEIDAENTGELVEKMSAEQLSEIVETMPPDEAADLLETMDRQVASAVLTKIDAENSQQIRELLSYPSDSAGGIMSNEFFYLDPCATVGEAREKFLQYQPEADELPAVVICRDDMKLLGVVPPEELLGASDDKPMSALMERANITVSPDEDQENCARYFRRYNLKVLPVIDAHRRILGLITIDDVLEIIEQEAAEDMFLMVGVGSERPLEESTLRRALKRMPWFVVTIINMSILGYIIRAFQPTLEQVVAVSFFIPAIMGLCGNVGVQAATITVRGLASGEINFGDTLWLLRRELLVGMIVGVFCGVILSGVSMFLEARPTAVVVEETFASPESGDTIVAQEQLELSSPAKDKILGVVPRFPLAVALAMMIGALGAVTLGTCVPLFFHRVGIDPAIASGPFVTTIVDIGTQTLYLTLVTWLLIS
ncbi:MAG: magnesium transporter [Planctomycetota bacterium]|jgi:magnesium transporter|nr:magnesium transporter [Planctomycetota bacterium]